MPPSAPASEAPPTDENVSLTVAIVGAGMAGLTAALALAAKGIAVDILERASGLDAVGAGLQLSPNATRILAALGLSEALAPHWVEPDEIRLADGRSLRRVATVPAGRFARNRWDAPYAVVSRADLQRALADAVRAHPLCRLHLGTPVADATPEAIARHTGRHPDLIVGADGVRSNVRATMGLPPARFSGNVAWRLTVPPGRPVPHPFDPTVVTAFLGRNAHLVAYPMGAGGGLNLVAIGSGRAEQADGDIAARDAVSALLNGWNPALRDALKQAEPLGRWPLYEIADGDWHDGTRILIGDAAHAMMPFSAQGTAMAIEDAAALADTLSGTTRLQTALETFVALRKPRIERVRARGAFNRFAYHAAGPLRLGRNLVLSLRPPERLAEDFDWLYAHRLPGA
ncbi:FAD-dependent monooxygenase [Rhizobium sp. Leaf371]|uniref:FAD-dependent monooxygenase n=1 Tax=Rhizobium sp. Leaf371 TaxID=1736355 RepID=UPI0009E92C46|nr:FAD-dependent monooxygenase [Rhizobium sp. Leaf371]